MKKQTTLTQRIETEKIKKGGKKQAAPVTHQEQPRQPKNDTKPMEGIIMVKKQKDSKKKLEDLEEAVNKDLEKMLKMKLTDFKVETVDHAKQLYGILFKLVERIVENQKDLKGCLEVIIEKLSERDKLLCNAFEERDNKIENIAVTVFMLVCKTIGGQISRKDREIISDALGRKWTDDSEALFTNAAMVQGSS